MTIVKLYSIQPHIRVQVQITETKMKKVAVTINAQSIMRMELDHHKG